MKKGNNEEVAPLIYDKRQRPDPRTPAIDDIGSHSTLGYPMRDQSIGDNS